MGFPVKICLKSNEFHKFEIGFMITRLLSAVIGGQRIIILAIN
jgi:hypothetical protein